MKRPWMIGIIGQFQHLNNHWSWMVVVISRLIFSLDEEIGFIKLFLLKFPWIKNGHHHGRPSLAYSLSCRLSEEQADQKPPEEDPKLVNDPPR